MALRLSNSNLILTAAEMKDLELRVCAEKKLSLLDLMEAAGEQVADFIGTQLSSFISSKSKIIILSGPGNNGGDGLVVGRRLLSAGYNVDVILLQSSKYSAELQQQILIYQSQSIKYETLYGEVNSIPGAISIEQLYEKLANCSLLVDCLLGSGQIGNPRALIKAACEVVNQAKANNFEFKILSVDVPTGVDCETGAIFQPHLSANYTVVIQHLKRGLVQYPAFEMLGEVVLVDAGINSLSFNTTYSLLNDKVDFLSLKPRNKNSHKGDFGNVLVLAGSIEMPGAGQLAASSCLRAGAGLVTALSFSENSINNYPEIIRMPVHYGLSLELKNKVIKSLSNFSCIILGPGLGRGPLVNEFVGDILKEIAVQNIPCVLDADGLNALSELSKNTKDWNLPTIVMTPHPGEAATLLEAPTQAIQSRRFEAVEKISGLFGATVVLKGANSICFDGAHGFVNLSGGAFLATAGSGDVLSGIIASFLAAGFKPLSAASIGVFLHGVAGEIAFDKHKGPIIASDIVNNIPFAIGKYVSKNH